jgi:uncharacterized protein
MGSTGELIIEARKAAGLTQTELARRAGTSQAAIARYETCVASPAVATLERVLRAAGRHLQLSAVPAEPADLSTPQAACLRRHRKEVLELAHEFGARNVRIFGSVARGEAGPDSDIDLLVDLNTGAEGLLPVLRLNEALGQLLGFKVDVAPEDLLRPEVAVSAHAEAMAL